MPQHKSCVKRLRQSANEKVRNNAIRTLLRKTMKETKATLAAGEEVDLKKAYTSIDKVWSKGIIHKRKAARLKSRMTKAMARLKSE
ncbi:MAG: 30S ribosomal protein S20 [candidate division Zixibacteria bacterium]